MQNNDKEQILEDKLRETLDALVANIDMDELDEYDDEDVHVPIDNNNSNSDDDKDMTSHTSITPMPTSTPAAAAPPAASTPHTPPRGKWDDVPFAESPLDPISQEKWGNSFPHLLSSASRIATICLFILFLPSMILAMVLPDHSHVEQSSLDADVPAEQRTVASLGEPSLIGYIVKTDDGHAIEYLGQNTIQFKMVNNGRMYIIRTCLHEITDGHGIKKTTASDYFVNGTSFAEQPETDQPYAKVWAMYNEQTDHLADSSRKSIWIEATWTTSRSR